LFFLWKRRNMAGGFHNSTFPFSCLLSHPSRHQIVVNSSLRGKLWNHVSIDGNLPMGSSAGLLVGRMQLTSWLEILEHAPVENVGGGKSDHYNFSDNAITLLYFKIILIYYLWEPGSLPARDRGRIGRWKWNRASGRRCAIACCLLLFIGGNFCIRFSGRCEWIFGSIRLWRRTSVSSTNDRSLW
jgi:hypothetical protein